jgi:uncharacterized membrane protein
MLSATIDFTNLLLAALVVGAMFGVWLFLNPAGLDAGAATILVTIVAAVIGRDDRTRLGLLIAAVACFVVAGLTTRFLNQPINRIVMTWSVDAPPPMSWAGLRDEWWRWHMVRLFAGLGGLSLLIAATLKRAWIG